MWTTDKLRKEFLSYFAEKGHTVVPSSSVVPSNDKSLLFTNSGMVQFKDILLGEPTTLKSACSVQRCIRAGGKHNDLDDVGKDTYHHTYFEMLGNWSFGDYFKEEAIDYAWDFLVNILKIDRSRLYVTYYAELDSDSHKFWSKYLPNERILSASRKDNFWEMGDTGPCGPCTEIHYDRIGDRNAAHLVNMDDPDVIEIWNIVFIEFNNTPSGLVGLDKKCIDTGIGLERVLSILNNVRSNYLIDSFTKIIRFIETNCGYQYKNGNSPEDIAFRVLADHGRTICVCLHDGVGFSNDGVGYVLRRILRRATRYAHDILNIEQGVISKIVKVSAEAIGVEPKNIDLVDAEEKLFMKTLKKGVERFNKMIKEKDFLSSEEIFVLYDTYGFPVDLTEILANEKNIKLDFSSYDECKNKAKELSKKSNERINEIVSSIKRTDDSFKYKENNIKAKLIAYVIGKEFFCSYKEIPENIEVGFIFDQTCFYGECGGQIGDIGIITFSNGSTVSVTDTQLCNGYVIHYGRLEGKISNEAILTYDEEFRKNIKKNHTSTHLLNYFLRDYIKTEQKGSLVTAEKFRLDFESKPLDVEVLREIEKKINILVEKKLDVKTFIMNSEDINEDIIHMKNEKYPTNVRVIQIKDDERIISELCGGTHVSNTSEIEKVRLLTESSISSNTRRIVGVSGKSALDLELKVSEYKKFLEQGLVISMDKNLPLLDKIELEILNKKNIKLQNSRKNEVYAENKTRFKEAIENGNIFEYKNLNFLTKKDVVKNALILLKDIKNVEMLIYSIFDDEVLLFLKSADDNNKLKELQKKFCDGRFRSSNGIIQGSIENTANFVEALLSMLKI